MLVLKSLNALGSGFLAARMRFRSLNERKGFALRRRGGGAATFRALCFEVLALVGAVIVAPAVLLVDFAVALLERFLPAAFLAIVFHGAQALNTVFKWRMSAKHIADLALFKRIGKKQM